MEEGNGGRRREGKARSVSGGPVDWEERGGWVEEEEEEEKDESYIYKVVCTSHPPTNPPSHSTNPPTQPAHPPTHLTHPPTHPPHPTPPTYRAGAGGGWFLFPM